jgi:hypothetical protein
LRHISIILRAREEESITADTQAVRSVVLEDGQYRIYDESEHSSPGSDKIPAQSIPHTYELLAISLICESAFKVGYNDASVVLFRVQRQPQTLDINFNVETHLPANLV